MGPLDWANAAGNFVTGLIRTHKMDQWAAKVWAMALSCLAAYCGSAGISLHNGASALVAKGDGLIAVCGVITAAIMMDPRLRGQFILKKDLQQELSEFEVVDKK